MSLTPEMSFFSAQGLSSSLRVLDVGCGNEKKVPWAVGLDRVPTAAADVVHDLDTYPWPLKSRAFDLVIASHVVEHVKDVLRFCEEIHRLCVPGAMVKIATPHCSSPDAWADPTHLRAFAYRSFEFVARPQDAQLPLLERRFHAAFGMKVSVAGWYTEPRFEIVDRRITFRKIHRVVGLDRFARHLPLMYEYYLSGLAPARDLQVTLRAL
jgi:SAM-dependent methyltransferase